jgi:amino acid transporter
MNFKNIENKILGQKLKKDLKLFELFCISTGAMISSGLFVLPGIAFTAAGPSVIISYLIASLLIIPAFLSTAELATAMPKAGGNYFFTDRSIGPWVGTLVGMSDWFSLALKSAFALIGIGSFLLLFFPDFTEIQIKAVAIIFCLISVVVNIAGIKHSGRFQAILVIFLLAILVFYIAYGSFFLEGARYSPFVPYGFNSMFATAGLVAISFGGLTKIPNVAEEVKNPGRTIPLAMMISWLVVTVLYALVVFVTIGLVSPERLSGSLIPISIGAQNFLGLPGALLLGLAALFAYITTATAGVLTASRTPFAMSRDALMPNLFQKLSSRGIPVFSILITSAFMIIIILFLSLEALIKVASTSFLYVYMFNNLSVILMRQSRLPYYQPKYKAPFYPYLQILGILGYGFLIVEMGLVAIISVVVFSSASLIWYLIYGKRKIQRECALDHLVCRARGRQEKRCMLNEELRSIMLSNDFITKDQFKRLIKKAIIIDLDKEYKWGSLLKMIADIMASRIGIKTMKLRRMLRRDKKDFKILLHSGVVCMNVVIPGKDKFEIVLLRDKKGISFTRDDLTIHAAFILLYSADQKDFFLNSFVWIVDIAEKTDFDEKWLHAKNIDELRYIILESI